MAVSVIPTLDLERAIAEQGYDVIVGFDEVGRGSLAGPVMVGAAAIWARDLDGPAGASQGGSQESSHLEVPKGVADSKMLTEHKREAIFDELKSWCASWAVGAASNKEIDEWGISHALGVAALRALAQAEAKLGIDGNGMLSGKPVKVGAIDPRRTERLHHQDAEHLRRARSAGAGERYHQSERRPVLRRRGRCRGHRQSHPGSAHGRTGSATPI